MTRYSHHQVMKVKISELKARLSAYIAAVRGGETIIVCDRNTPVARLAPLQDGVGGLQVLPASGSPADISRVRGVRLERAVDVLRVLRDSRGER